MEYRIYVKGKLVNICSGVYALYNNIEVYRNKYGIENVRINKVETVMDVEKEEWLKTI